ncbi:PIN domain-containing protein [Roseomonas sp. AR75]|uniref:PIN domain-containing protein n=1 Tax=Roseomonas sp. AR75 TaxID=2562311 RepID=UPI00148507AD|nr:PIN domain-containing protein [Roseomonas sp. AR75]
MILDASAILAAVLKEPGGETVMAALPASAVSAVNWLEVLARIIVGPEAGKLELSRVSVAVLPFEAAMAHGASGLLARHRGVLSLGDCACIATAAALGRPVLTADRVWATLGLPVEVRLIR